MARFGAGRLKPLIPFGGVCRLIDFSIANVRRSGIPDVLLLSQHEERELMDDLFRTWWTGGFRVHFGPYDEAYREAYRRGDATPRRLPEPAGPPERGTADALIRKAPYIFTPDVTEVLILHADHVYTFDHRYLIREHRASGAALTIAYQRIEPQYVHLFGMVTFDRDGYLTAFQEKPRVVTSDLVFAAFCVFDARALHRYLELLDGTGWQHDVSKDVIPAMLAAGERIRGYPVRSYWEDIGTVDRYHRAHLALLDDPPTMTVAEMPWVVEPGIGRRFVAEATGIRRSVVPDDLVNDGTLSGCVAFPGVRVGTGAEVRDSVLLPGAAVPAGAAVTSAVVTESGAVEHIDAPPAGARP